MEDFIYLMNGLKPIPIEIPLQIIIPAISYNSDAEKPPQASFGKHSIKSMISGNHTRKKTSEYR